MKAHHIVRLGPVARSNASGALEGRVFGISRRVDTSFEWVHGCCAVPEGEKGSRGCWLLTKWGLPFRG